MFGSYVDLEKLNIIQCAAEQNGRLCQLQYRLGEILFSLHQTKFNERQIRWIAVLLSLLFSLLVIAQDEIINNDAAFYLIAADLISQGEWKAALTLYPWPFFPILLSFVSQITGLIPEYAAYLLSTLFLTLVVVNFIDFARQLGGDTRAQLLAALVILSLPYFNESRSEILRDHGYWLFFLIGLRFLFQHYQDPQAKWGLGWNIAILISCLFRMEGFVMMALLPLILFLKKGSPLKQRLVVFTQANVISLFLLIVGLLLLPLVGDNLGRLDEFSSRPIEFWNAVTIGLEQKAEVIRQGVLPPLSEKFAMQSVVLMLALIVTMKTLKVLTPLYGVILLLPRLYSQLALPQGFRPFVVWVVLVNLLMLILFVVPLFFLQARFSMPLVLSSLLLVPFLLNAAWSLWQQKRNDGVLPRLFPAAIAIVILMGADGLVSFGGYSKQYLRDSAEWIQFNTEAGSRIVTTESLRFCYYINRGVQAEQHHICQYIYEPQENIVFDYLVIYVEKGRIPAEWENYLEQTHLLQVRMFNNRRNDAVLIYQRDQMDGYNIE